MGSGGGWVRAAALRAGRPRSENEKGGRFAFPPLGLLGRAVRYRGGRRAGCLVGLAAYHAALAHVVVASAAGGGEYDHYYRQY